MVEQQIDHIERTVTFSAPIERAWKAITEPQQISKWFGDHAEINNLRVGEEILFGWKEHNSHRAIIEEVDAPRRFAYRWHAGQSDMNTPFDSAPSTLVTFTLEAIDGGTRLTVLETGFAALPEAIRERSLRDNTSGWQAELDDLSAYLNG